MAMFRRSSTRRTTWPTCRGGSCGLSAMSAPLAEVVVDSGAVHADRFGDLGDGVLPLPVRPGRFVHAADGSGLPLVQLGFAAADAAQGPVELGAGGVLAGGGVGEDLVAPEGGQVIDLAVVVLAAGGHPRVPDLRHHAAPARRAAGAYVRPGRGCPHRYPAAVTSRIAAMTLTVAQTASWT